MEPVYSRIKRARMNPFKLGEEESFTMGESNLVSLLDSPCKVGHGVILYCHVGMANISVDLNKWEIVPNTFISLIPEAILTLNHSSDDFKVQYIAFSSSMFQEAVFRLDPPFSVLSRRILVIRIPRARRRSYVSSSACSGRFTGTGTTCTGT